MATLIETLQTTEPTGPNHAPAYAWPGGYPIYYLCADSGVLCPKCVNKELRRILEATLGLESDAQWDVWAADINWEDGEMVCDHCNKRIESAYAE